MIDSTISHYKILSEVGRGGMGVVYKAEDTKLERPVALKFLAGHAVEDPEHKARFLREAKAAARLDHQNICPVYEIDEVDGQMFLAMAYLEGQTLKDKIAERPLKLDEAFDIAIQTAQGLKVAHQKEIVHRDIKPANLMLTEDGPVKIMDFGLAQLADRSKLTKTATILGTPAYMSPEQAQRRPTDRRTDIWSLGVVIYEMVSGRLPFEAEREEAVAYSIVHEEPEPLTAQRVDVPVELDRIVSKAMAKSPDERYQHVDELLVDLKQLKLSSAKSAAKIPPAGVKRAVRWKQAAAGIALLAFGALLSWLSLQTTRVETSRLENMLRRRVTFDDGLAMHPTISPSGEFVAYASDRAGEGHLDLWLQQVGGGEPVRLTSDPADELEPAFSPDGREIVFRSDKDGGGIYIMPGLGGEPRFLAAAGLRPRFSPDGGFIVYWTGAEHNVINNTIYVISATGGEPQELFAGRSPVWSPDGGRILFLGDREDMSKPERNWFVGDPSTRSAVPVDVPALLSGQGLTGEPLDQDLPFLPSAWTENGEALFSARLGDSWNIWAVRLSLEGSIEGRPRRLTVGGGYERSAFSTPDGRVAFTSGTINEDIWSLPVDANSGKMTGPPTRLTSRVSSEAQPSVAADGKTLVFRTDRAGQLDLWIMDLAVGKASPFAVSPAIEDSGFLNPNGSVVFYQHRETIAGERRQTIYEAPRGSGQRREICTNCGSPWDVSPDGETIVSYKFIGLTNFKLLFTDVASGEQREVNIRGRALDLRYSPDGQWLAFHSLPTPGNRQVFVARPRAGPDGFLAGPKPITDGSSNDFRAAWSPDGRLIYYASERDGYRCIYAQPVSDETKDPIGEPREVFHSHDPRLSLGGVLNLGAIGLSVAHDKIVIAMSENRGDIWLLEPGDSP